MAQAFHGTVWIRPVAGSAAALIRALGVVASRLLEQMGSRTRVASACVTPALILCMLAMLASPIILHTTAPSTWHIGPCAFLPGSGAPDPASGLGSGPVQLHGLFTPTPLPNGTLSGNASPQSGYSRPEAPAPTVQAETRQGDEASARMAGAVASPSASFLMKGSFNGSGPQGNQVGVRSLLATWTSSDVTSAGVAVENAPLRNGATPVKDESQPLKGRQGISHAHRVKQLMTCMTALMACTATSASLCHMFQPQGNTPGGGGGGAGRDGTTNRIPPRWSPDMRRGGYDFAHWINDLQLWMLQCEMQPHQQCAAIILRLGGTAREMTRTLTAQEIIRGGVIPGQGHVDPVTFLLHGLQMRFAQLGEETRLEAMTAMMSFRRNDREPIDDMLARFDTLRVRAANVGQYVQSTEAYALQLLRAIGVNSEQIVNLLSPYGQRLPANDQQFEDMKNRLRRMGHILEAVPGNIASTISGRSSHHLVEQAYHSHDSHLRNSSGWDQQAGPTSINANEPHGDWWQAVQAANPENFAAAPAWPQEPTRQGDWQSGDPSGAGQSAGVFMARSDNPSGFDSGTDTDTLSDSGNESLEMTDLAGLSEQEAGELLYWQMHRAKTKWRRFTNKPVRKARRFVRRHGGKGGHRSRAFLSDDSVLTYLKGKGKGKSRHTSGKGFGRQRGKNPIGRDGTPLKCHTCGSDEHLARHCPKGGGKGGKGSSASSGSGHAPVFHVGPQDQPPVRVDRTSPLGDLLAGIEEVPQEGPSVELFVGMVTTEGERRIGPAVVVDDGPGPPGTTPKRAARPNSASTNTTESWSIPPSTYAEDPLFTGDPWLNPQSPTLHSAPASSSYGPQRPTRQSQQPQPAEPVRAESSTGALWPPPPASTFLTSAVNHEFVPALETATGATSDLDLQNLVLNAAARAEAGNLRPPRPWNSNQQESNRRRAESPDSALNRMHGLNSVLSSAVGGVAEGIFYTAPPSVPPPPVNPITVAAWSGSVAAPPPLFNRAVLPPDLALSPLAEAYLSSTGEDFARRMHSLQHFVAQSVNQTAQQETAEQPAEPVRATAPVREPSPARRRARSASSASRASSLSGSAANPIYYDGDERSCSICREQLEAGTRVVRLRCRHMFHANCWVDLCNNTPNPSNVLSNPSCPNCRGPGHVIATWDFIQVGIPTQPGQQNLLTRDFPGAAPEAFDAEYMNIITPRSVNTEALDTPFQSPMHYITLPATYHDAALWEASGGHAIGGSVSTSENRQVASSEEPPAPAARQGEQRTYHADTRLKDGRPALLVDPGSRGNLAGSEWMRDAAREAMRFNKRPVERQRENPLNVMGVGNGSQCCRFDCEMPVAIQRADGTVATGTFTAPTVDNSGLPALLGLQSLRDARALLDMHTMQLHFCGPNGAQIELSPGSQTFRLELSPSGHLVVPCCEFKKASQKADNGSFVLQPQEQLSLAAQPVEATPSGGASSSSSSPSRL